MAQFHWDPDTYLGLVHAEVPEYERLQHETAAATGAQGSRLLELGTGTGETARRVLERHPSAVLIGLDASADMLEHAAVALPAERVLEAAGLRARLSWADRDLAVLVGESPPV